MKKVLIAFLALMILAGASDVARRLGWIDGLAEKRAIGLVIGAMALVIGNYLPKIRPLRSPSAERFAVVVVGLRRIGAGAAVEDVGVN